MWNPRSTYALAYPKSHLPGGFLDWAVRVIPGVSQDRQSMIFTADLAPTMAKLLGVELGNVGPDPVESNSEFDEMRPRMRKLQIVNSFFLAEREAAYCCEPMRTGKCGMVIGGTALLQTRRTLVVTISLARMGWVDEIQRLRPNADIFLLFGRAGQVIRKRCPKCKLCRQRGWRRVDFDEVVKSSLAYVVVNYEILMGHNRVSKRGVVATEEHLPGWGQALSARGLFGVACLDELHKIRGWRPSDNENNKRETLRRTIAGIPVVWGASGSEIYGRTSDLWPALDLISGGTAGSPFKFHARYCGGAKVSREIRKKGQEGEPQTITYWSHDGISNPGELTERLETFRCKHPLAEHDIDMPEMTRIRVTVENEEENPKKLRKLLGEGSTKTAALEATLGAKMATLVEKVLGEALEGDGGKPVVWAQRRAAVDEIRDALKKAAENKTNAPRARQVDLKIFSAHGEQSVNARRATAQKFSSHEGGAIIVLTIEGFDAGVSLRGGRSNHYAQLTDSPAPIQQTEARIQAPGAKGLYTLLYVLENSIDEHVADVLLPKLELLAKVAKEQEALPLAQMVAGIEKETREEINIRLAARMAQLRAEADEIFEGI